jgi:hypothetical protein
MATAEEIGWSIPDYRDPRHATVASAIAFLDRPGTTLSTCAVAVDTLIPADTHVTFIKIDVQGCDLRALRGLRQTLDRCRPPVVFEYEGISADWHGDPFEAYLAFFLERQYTVQQIQIGMSDFLALPEQQV